MLVLGTLVWLGITYLHWATTHFVITTDRLIYRHGILSKHGIEIPLERDNTVFFSQTILERMLGSGDLVIESAGEMGRQSFSNVRKPSAVQNEIYRQMEANENRKFDRLGGRAAVEPFPVRRAVGRERHIGEDAVSPDGGDRVRIRLAARAGVRIGGDFPRRVHAARRSARGPARRDARGRSDPAPSRQAQLLQPDLRGRLRGARHPRHGGRAHAADRGELGGKRDRQRDPFLAHGTTLPIV